jgi:hypothetical protein
MIDDSLWGVEVSTLKKNSYFISENRIIIVLIIWCEWKWFQITLVMVEGSWKIIPYYHHIPYLVIFGYF